MLNRIRKIDNIDFAEKRIEPHTTWDTYSNWLFNIFGDLTDNPNPKISLEILKELYCNERGREFDEAFILSIATGIRGAIVPKCDIEPDKLLSEMLQDPIVSSRTPFLIIGNVGVGKSTYLHHFFKVDLIEKKLDKLMDAIIIDCRKIGDYENSTKNISQKKIIDHIDNQIDIQLKVKFEEFNKPSYEIMKKIFNEEIKHESFIVEELRKIKKFDLAEEKLLESLGRLIRDRHLYNIGRIRFIKRKYNKKIFLVLDNVDHHSHNLQKTLFQLSKSLIEDYHCPFILACRDYTLPLAYKHMELSAFEPRFIHLTAPKINCVINKRKNYMLKKIKNGDLRNVLGSDAIVVENELGRKKLDIFELDKIISNILDSFLTENILYSLNKLSNKDIRHLLKLIKIALSSGYIYPEERRIKYDAVRHYDFIRALMLGNNQYYNPKATVIINLFENEKPNDEGNNLIRIRLLQAISTFGERSHTRDVIDFMESIGYPKIGVNDIIYQFLLADLIESPLDEIIKKPPYDDKKKPYSVEFLRLTSCGKYYLNNLIFEMRYLEEIKYSSYMPKRFYENMKNFDKYDRTSRFESTQEFLYFIQHEEQLELKRVKNMDNYQRFGDSLFDMLNKKYNESRHRVEKFSDR